jgi:hypothetical protein
VPRITAAGPATREAGGRLRLPFAAEDDHGVTGGRAVVTLDLAAVDRRHGLAIAPEPREPLVIDLPMPIRGERTRFEEALIDDVSQHPFANLPVLVRLEADDAAGQTGRAEPLAMVLPGRRFFDPLAAALIEQGAFALSPRGEFYSSENIRERLGMRDFMEGLRGAGVDISGPPALSQADRQAFARQLERFLAQRS